MEVVEEVGVQGATSGRQSDGTQDGRTEGGRVGKRVVGGGTVFDSDTIDSLRYVPDGRISTTPPGTVRSGHGFCLYTRRNRGGPSNNLFV